MRTEASLQALLGMRVSDIWFSDHSICYIELGTLSRGRILPNGSVGNPVGEVTVFLGYDWLFRIEEILLSRKQLHANELERDALMGKMLGAIVESARMIRPGLEIEIGISTGVTLLSASPDGDGPDWDISIARSSTSPQS